MTMTAQHDLRKIRHIVLDMDGTIYKGKQLFGCTLPFLETLRAAGIGYTFLTNNTSRSKADYVEKLHAFGIPVAEEQIYTPADSAIVYLRERLNGVQSIAVLGTPSLCRQFEQAGFGERPLGVFVACLPVLLHGSSGELKGLAGRFIAVRLVFQLNHGRDLDAGLFGQELHVRIVLTGSRKVLEQFRHRVTEFLRLSVLL
jgi:hypothetical protein